MQRFPETKNALDHFDIPTTVKDAENLMQEDLALKEKMINLFAESELKMDEFLTTLKGQQEIEHKSVSTVLWSCSAACACVYVCVLNSAPYVCMYMYVFMYVF